MALDEVLLGRLRSGRRGPALRIWRWAAPALVIGSHQSVRNEVDTAAARALGFTVTRRISGGGTMLAEPGRTVTFSVYAPADLVRGLTLVESFRRLDAFAVAALQGLGVPAGYRPINDIVSPGGKIGGAAQARRGPAVLHHTTMAHSMDPLLLERLLRLGRERVSPVGIRSAVRVVTPIDTFTGVGPEEVVRALAGAFARLAPLSPAPVDEGEEEEARALARDKFSTPAWIERLP
ncbi:MAG: lipoate--protein ligase family protein [Candidatus Dormibacterales bacterium]